MVSGFVAFRKNMPAAVPGLKRFLPMRRSKSRIAIDFGEVSMAMRDLLRRMGKKRFNPGTAAGMFFLNATNPETIKLTRKVMIDWGYKAQRVATTLFKAFGKPQTKRPPAT